LLLGTPLDAGALLGAPPADLAGYLLITSGFRRETANAAVHATLVGLACLV